MAVVVDQAAFASLMKERFMTVSNALFEKTPLYALLEKDESAGGTDMKYPIETQTTQGIAADFPTSISSQSAGANYAWLMTLRTLYSTAEVNATTWRRAMGSENSFVDMLADTSMKAMRGHQLELGGAIFRDSTGVRGQASGTISGAGVVTLANPDDIYNFYKDMTLQANTVYGGNSPLAQAGFIVAIDYNSGKFTLSETMRGVPAQPSGWSAASLYFNRLGTLNKMLSGLQDWIPVTAPISTDPLFYGVPRWEDSKLYGVYQQGAAGRDNTSAFIQLAGKIASLGGTPRIGCVNYKSWNAIKDTFQGTIPYESVDTAAGISFRSLVLETDGGKVNIVADPRCIPKTGWLLDPSTIEFISDGAPTGVLRYPGRQEPYFVRPDNDNIQLRIGGDENFIVKIPGYNGRASLTV